MSNDIELSSFPSNRVQALAMLYTQNQDLKGKTPKEVAEIYISAYDEINSTFREIRNNKFQ